MDERLDEKFMKNDNELPGDYENLTSQELFDQGRAEMNHGYEMMQEHRLDKNSVGYQAGKTEFLIGVEDIKEAYKLEFKEIQEHIQEAEELKQSQDARRASMSKDELMDLGQTEMKAGYDQMIEFRMDKNSAQYKEGKEMFQNGLKDVQKAAEMDNAERTEQFKQKIVEGAEKFSDTIKDGVDDAKNNFTQTIQGIGNRPQNINSGLDEMENGAFTRNAGDAMAQNWGQFKDMNIGETLKNAVSQIPKYGLETVKYFTLGGLMKDLLTGELAKKLLSGEIFQNDAKIVNDLVITNQEKDEMERAAEAEMNEVNISDAADKIPASDAKTVEAFMLENSDNDFFYQHISESKYAQQLGMPTEAMDAIHDGMDKKEAILEFGAESTTREDMMNMMNLEYDQQDLSRATQNDIKEFKEERFNALEQADRQNKQMPDLNRQAR